MNPIQILIKKIEEEGLWSKYLSLDRKEFLKVKGSIDTNLYYVLSGSLRVFVVDEYEEHTIRLGYQGDFIASLDSFISEKPSELYIQALKKTKLKVISKTVYLNLYNLLLII